MTTAKEQLLKLEETRKLDKLLNQYEDTDYFFYLRLKEQLEHGIVFNFYSYEDSKSLMIQKQLTLSHVITSCFNALGGSKNFQKQWNPIRTLFFADDHYILSFSDNKIKGKFIIDKTNEDPRVFNSYQTNWTRKFEQQEERTQGYTARIRLIKSGKLRALFEDKFVRSFNERIVFFQNELKDNITSALRQFTKYQLIPHQNKELITKIAGYYNVTINEYDDISKIRESDWLWDGGLKDLAYIRMFAQAVLDNPSLLQKEVSVLTNRMDKLLYEERQSEMDSPEK